MRRNNAGRIQEFADDLRNYVDTPGPLSKFGIVDLEKQDERVMKILQDALMATTMVAKIAKEVEFYVQGDIDKKTFLKRYDKLEELLKAELA